MRQENLLLEIRLFTIKTYYNIITVFNILSIVLLKYFVKHTLTLFFSFFQDVSFKQFNTNRKTWLPDQPVDIFIFIFFQ